MKSAFSPFGSFKPLAQPTALKGFKRTDFPLPLIKKLLWPKLFMNKLFANTDFLTSLKIVYNYYTLEQCLDTSLFGAVKMLND